MPEKQLILNRNGRRITEKTMIVNVNGDANAKKINTDWQRFVTYRRLSPEQVRIAKDAMDRLCKEYPAFVNCASNQEELSEFLVSKNQLPRWDAVRDAFLDLVPTGKLILNPAALGADMEQRYGDELSGAYAMSRVSADDLRRMTMPASLQSEREAIDRMNADEFYASEYGRPLREERNRQADNFIREQQAQQEEAAVDFFLAANRDYARTNENRALMLKWLADRKLPMTTNTLQEAFHNLKDELELSPENNAEYGATRVINMADLGERNLLHNRPERQHVELVDQKSVKKITLADIRKWSAEEYAAALNDTDLAPQVEALLANQ